MRWLRTKLGLGNWQPGGAGYKRRLESVHPLVPISPDEPAIEVSVAPITAPSSPVITVVITAHDDGPFIDTCLWSVRAQELAAWECLVVDDASLDDTADVVRRHAEADPRIRLLRRDRNVGLAAARNTGITAAIGRFITFLDADDFMFPGTLRARVEAATSDDPAVAGSWCDWASVPEVAGLEFPPPGPGRFSTIDYSTGMGENQVISTSPVLLREVVESLGGYDDSFRTAEDFEFACRLFRNGFRLRFSGCVGVAYRQKRSSMIAGDPAGHARNAMRVYDYMSRPLLPTSICATAVAPVVEPPDGIPSEIKRIERLISFLTFAVLGGDESQIAGIKQLIPPGLLGPTSFLIGVDDRIDAAIRRHSTRSGAPGKTARTRVEAQVKTLLAERGVAGGEVAEMEPHFGSIDLERVAGAAIPHSRVRGPRLPGEAGPWDVVLVAQSVDACRELALIGRELVEIGLRVAMVDRGSCDLRRAMLSEGLHRVVAPVARARLLITSNGSGEGVLADRHLVVAAEPLVVASVDGLEADLVHARGAWEVPFLTSLGPTEVVGWHTRYDRVATTTAPMDGQADRSRSETVLLHSAGTVSAHEALGVRDLLGDYPLLFSADLCARGGESLEEPVLRCRMALMRAVITLGPGLPADALLAGTPVLAVDSDTPVGVEGVQSVTLNELTSVLPRVTPHVAATPASARDPLQHHVDAALELLG